MNPHELIVKNVYDNEPFAVLQLSTRLRSRWLSVLSMVFYFNKSSHTRPILKHICLLLKAIASHLRNKNCPKIPVDDTADQSAYG